MLNNNDEVTPTQFHLSQNYPNPFRERTAIKYCVAYKTRVQISVYDSEGNLIEKLVDEEKNAGTFEVEFSIYSSEGRNLEAGTYYYRLEAGEYKSEKKMELIK
jgi:flagellar hook assembly protein FlgD